MMRSRLYAVAALLAGAGALPAQNTFLSVTSYEVGLPVGDTRRFVADASWLGLSWEGRWSVGRHTLAGISLGFNDFSEHFNGTTHFPSGAATGPQYRYLVAAPLLGTGYLYPFGGRRVRWYAGGGAGAAYVEQGFQLGTWPATRHAWHFVVAPELGAEMRGPDGDLVGLVSLRFNAPIAAGDYVGGGTRSFRYVSLRFGIGEWLW